MAKIGGEVTEINVGALIKNPVIEVDTEYDSNDDSTISVTFISEPVDITVHFTFDGALRLAELLAKEVG
jgi:hypothetical protein